MIQKVKRFFTFATSLYIDGFKNMRLGKKLWLIIAIKFFFLFVVLKYFFFPDVMRENFKSNQERSLYILNQLTKEK